MSDQQPAVPSDAQAPADTQPQPASSEQAEAPSRSSSWLRRIWRGRGAEEEEPEPSQDTQAGEQASSRISLTQDELDRRVQAETDRREAKRAAQALAERRRKLRDEDPWQYAEEERQAETAQVANDQIGNLFAQIGVEHDKYTLDPLVQALPDQERARILALEGAGQGLDGRKLIATESLKALEKHWRAEGAKDAEKRLRGNPAFRKQVLSEFRRGVPEPEFIGSGTVSSNGEERNVSNLLRQNMSHHRSA